MKYTMIRMMHILPIPEPEYLRQRTRLRRAGLKERQLRAMDPDARVAALEKARLDPYDYIFLAL